MLVLSRRSREAVVVGGGGGFPGLLKVTVLEVIGGKVKLGFEVDAGIPVNRLEVWERMCASGEIDSCGTAPVTPLVRSG
jgi:carbon storage regulator CsrA